MEHKIGIIGSHEEILGFKTLGLVPLAVREKDEVIKKLDECIEKKEFAVVFVVENWAEQVEEELLERSRGALPAVVTIPGYAGSKGMGEKKLRRIVEQAVGSDILFKDN